MTKYVSVMVRTPWLLHSILCCLNMSNVDIIIVDSLSSTIKLIILYVIIRASPTLASSMQTPSVCVCMLYILVLVLISVQGNYGSTTIFSLVSSFSEVGNPSLIQRSLIEKIWLPSTGSVLF